MLIFLASDKLSVQTVSSVQHCIDLAALATCEAGAGSVGGEGDPRVGVVVHTRPAAAHWTHLEIGPCVANVRTNQRPRLSA